ncbi:MAG: acyltransferase [Terracidiphilus sp.]|jgi:peptidoglycan/LPS O-acetylase OafA/YrhL
MAQRNFYIDRLRVVLTALVILHHTALTYGAIGGWFWREIEPSRTPSSILLILFCTTNQAWFMGFFFLLAGYFTPASLDRKGYKQFILDRLIRLGIPTLAFGLILGPLTAALVTFAQGDGFWSTFVWLWRHKQFISGPLWFAEALLVFSLCYALLRRIHGPQPGGPEKANQAPSPVPGWWDWFFGGLIVGVAALGLRQIFPIGTSLYGYWAMYVFLFVVGIRAKPRNWLAQLTWKNARPWIAIALVVWPTLPLGWKLALGNVNFNTGFSWGAFLYAFWEPFVAWGIIATLLLVFGEHMNEPSAFWEWLSRRAYAVYVIHPPVLVGIALMLHGWAAPALVKFGVVGVLACIATWLVADPLVRLPGLRNVV